MVTLLQSVTPEQTTLWYTRCGVPTSFGTALQRGLLQREFKDDGAAQFRALQSSPDPAVHQSHFTHSQPDSFRHGSIYPAIWAQATGADTRLLGLTFLRGAQLLLSAPDSPVRTPADLKGRRLLVLRRPHEAFDYHHANTIRLYEIALKAAGLTLRDVQLVERVIDRPFIGDRPTPELIGSGRAGSAPGARLADTVVPLLRGEVDIITSGGGIGAPALQHLHLLGLQPVFDINSVEDELERVNNSTLLVFAVKNDLLTRRADLVLRVLRRVDEAERLARSDPDGVIRDLADEQLVSEYLVRRAHGPELADSLHLDFAPAKIAALRSQVDYLFERQLIPRQIDIDAWLAPESLAVARSEIIPPKQG